MVPWTDRHYVIMHSLTPVGLVVFVSLSASPHTAVRYQYTSPDCVGSFEFIDCSSLFDVCMYTMSAILSPFPVVRSVTVELGMKHRV